MCGIAGFIDYNNKLKQNDLVNMTDALKHRGPDGYGYEIWKTEYANVGLGHRRLAIIDLNETGAQPMTQDKISITYNGEIYNFKEIRAELIKKNYSFKSESDTEVIIKSFLEWGIKCLDKFIGMFAFVLFDSRYNQVYFCRDRSGVKPFYYYKKNGYLLFASELKSFHTLECFEKLLNPAGVTAYFKYGFIPGEYCIFKNCYKLKPGHYAKCDLNEFEFKTFCYWSPENYLDTESRNLSEVEFEEGLTNLFKSAFNYRMVSDVPVGVFLSGGYDSSLVTAILQKDSTQKVKTFTVGFKDATYDESSYAEEVADYLKTDHTTILCDLKEAQEIVSEIPYYYDEPFADSSAIPTFLVSKVTSKHVKAVLSADGGDELFGGYKRNLKYLKYNYRLKNIPLSFRSLISYSSSFANKRLPMNIVRKGQVERLENFVLNYSLYNIFDIMSQYTTPNQRSQWIDKNSREESCSILKDFQPNETMEFNSMLALDYKSTLSNDMLVKVDRATMANSLEGREPLVDHRILEYVAGAPASYKINNGIQKYLLKELTHLYIPKEIMDRPKQGFGIPISYWLKNDLSYLVKEFLSVGNLKKYGVLNSEVIQKVVDEHMLLKNSNDQLWLLLNFQMWCNQWL